MLAIKVGVVQPEMKCGKRGEEAERREKN